MSKTLITSAIGNGVQEYALSFSSLYAILSSSSTGAGPTFCSSGRIAGKKSTSCKTYTSRYKQKFAAFEADSTMCLAESACHVVYSNVLEWCTPQFQLADFMKADFSNSDLHLKFTSFTRALTIFSSNLATDDCHLTNILFFLSFLSTIYDDIL